jgi:hypothetical protein
VRVDIVIPITPKPTIRTAIGHDDVGAIADPAPTRAASEQPKAVLDSRAI